MDLEELPELRLEPGKRPRYSSRPRLLAGLLAQDDLVVDQVEQCVGVAVQGGVLFEVGFDADRLAPLPAAPLVQAERNGEGEFHGHWSAFQPEFLRDALDGAGQLLAQARSG